LKSHFQGNDQVIFLKEPVDEWEKIKDKQGVTILEHFYADQEKYSFPFQMMAYISRLKLLRETFQEIQTKKHSMDDKKFIIISERSLFTDKMVFAKMLFDTCKIEFINYQIYLNWFETFAQDFPIQKIIYVKTAPDVCYNRIARRNRDGEDNIPLQYLTSCHEYHEHMMDTTSMECVCSTQLVLNGNTDIFENKSLLNEWVHSIETFIYEC
jgi:deoxyadenosine/deoxycytidine kinase